MKRTLALLVILLAVVPPAWTADNIDQLNQLIQSDFRNLSEDLGAVLSYKGVTPATPLGITGFDIGIEATATKLQHRDSWNRASSGTTSDSVLIPKLHLHKGLPAGFDLGVFYAPDPSSNIKLWAAEMRYALLQGGVAEPALGLRGTYSKLSGVNQLDFHTTGLELLISKGLAIFTPYAGLGRVWVTSQPVGVANLKKEEFSLGKYFIGGNLNFGLANLAFEADRTGAATSYSAKFGFRF